jgi:hypothetical protein
MPAGEIAVQLSLAAQDVEAVLARVEAIDSGEEAKRILLGAQAQLAQRIVDKASASDALEVFDRTGALPKPRDLRSGGVTVIIGGSDLDVDIGFGPGVFPASSPSEAAGRGPGELRVPRER